MKIKVDIDDDGIDDLVLEAPCKGGKDIKGLIVVITAIAALIGCDWLLL